MIPRTSEKSLATMIWSALGRDFAERLTGNVDIGSKGLEMTEGGRHAKRSTTTPRTAYSRHLAREGEAEIESTMIVPDAAIRYILYQRAYFRLPVNLLYRHVVRHLPFPVPIFNLAVALESRLFSTRIRHLYQQDIEQEYRTLVPVLPLRCSSILDIGCGVAGIDILLDHHYARQAPTIYLLDKSHVERSVYYLFRERGAFYTSLEVARSLLMRNGIAKERIHLLTANDENEIRVDGRIDLVISLLSWGFHYPVATYGERVRELLSETGVAILDVRKGTDGMEVLQRLFRSTEVIADTPKYQRVAVST